MLLDFHCLICTQPIAEERARRKAKFCSNGCRFEAEKRLKGIRTTKVKRTLPGAIPRVEHGTGEAVESLQAVCVEPAKPLVGINPQNVQNSGEIC